MIPCHCAQQRQVYSTMCCAKCDTGSWRNPSACALIRACTASNELAGVCAVRSEQQSCSVEHLLESSGLRIEGAPQQLSVASSVPDDQDSAFAMVQCLPTCAPPPWPHTSIHACLAKVALHDLQNKWPWASATTTRSNNLRAIATTCMQPVILH